MARARIDRTDSVSRERIDYGVCDARGRRMGCVVQIDRLHMVEAPADSSYFPVEPGVYYRASTKATRDDEAFGAITVSLWDSEIESLRRKVAKRVRTAMRRAARQGLAGR